MAPIYVTRDDEIFPLPSNFKFPTWKNGLRDLFCPHLQFSEFDFVHHIKSKCYFVTSMQGCVDFAEENRKAKILNAGIKGANASKTHLVSYNS